MLRESMVLLPPAQSSSYTNKDQETTHHIRDPTFMIGTDKHTCLEEAAAIGGCESIQSVCSESSANIRGPMPMILDNGMGYADVCSLHTIINTASRLTGLKMTGNQAIAACGGSRFIQANVSMECRV